MRLTGQGATRRKRATKHLHITVPGVVLCGLAAARVRKKNQPLKLVQKIAMPSMQGRIDHMSVDLKDKRLFVAGLGNQTVEVTDLAAGKPLHTISGLAEPQAVLYVPDSNLTFVADEKGRAV